MTTPRRRLIRPAIAGTPAPEQQRRLQRLRESLQWEQATLVRWMARLKRAFHAVEKSQRRIAQLQRQLTKTEDTIGSDHRGGRVANGRNDPPDERVRRR
jgi:hypothetical protein